MNQQQPFNHNAPPQPQCQIEGDPHCAHCAAALAAGYRYCPHCGHLLQLPASERTDTSVEPVLVSTFVTPVPGPVTQSPPLQAVAPAPTQQVPSNAPAAVLPPPARGTTGNTAAKSCSCGQVLNDKANFCAQCGQPHQQESGLWLVCASPQERQCAFQLTSDQVTIGKAPDCDLTLPGDDYLSRHHARLRQADGRLVLEDLGSSNGTPLKVRRPMDIEAGDEVLIGSSILRLEQRGPNTPS